MSRTPGRVDWLGPDLGQHTDEVLGSIGLTADDLRELRSRRVV